MCCNVKLDSKSVPQCWSVDLMIEVYCLYSMLYGGDFLKKLSITIWKISNLTLATDTLKTELKTLCEIKIRSKDTLVNDSLIYDNIDFGKSKSNNQNTGQGSTQHWQKFLEPSSLTDEAKGPRRWFLRAAWSYCHTCNDDEWLVPIDSDVAFL